MKGTHVVTGALAAALLIAAAQLAGAAEVDCLVQPRQTVSVSAPVEGMVESVGFERGDTVQKGQILAVLEASTERAALAVAQARAEMDYGIKASRVRVDFGVRRWRRTEEMFRQDLIALKDLDEAETTKILAEHSLIEAQENKGVADLEYERARVALELRTIRSPITGVVLERLRNPGEYTAKESPIAKIVQLDPLHVEVFAPLELSGHLAVGQRVVVMSELPASRPFEATIIVIDRVLDAASGTFGVRLEAPNPGNLRPAGLKCKARLPLSKSP